MPTAHADLAPEVKTALDATVAHAAVLVKPKPASTVVPSHPALESKVARLESVAQTELASWLLLQNFLDGRLRDLGAAAQTNVYDDADWRIETRARAAELCCLVRAMPELALLIRSRVAAGRMALPHGVQDNARLVRSIEADSRRNHAKAP